MTCEFFATVPQAMESLLASELEGFGAQNVKEKRTGVSFSGSLEVAYRACLWSRLANRILLRLSDFDAQDTDALYAGNRCVGEIIWMSNGSLAVDVSLRQWDITNSLFAAQRVKDAVVDQFRDLCGKRPSMDIGQPDLRLRVHVDKARASLSIERAGLSGLVQVERRDITDCQAPKGTKPRVVILNPPYGERLGELDALKVLYAKLGVELKTKFPGWTAYVLTASEILGRRLGLRATRSHQFFNGALPCRLFCVPIRAAAAEIQPPTESAKGTSPAVVRDHGRFAPSGDEMFANRLAKNLKRLRSWAKQHGISNFEMGIAVSHEP